MLCISKEVFMERQKSKHEKREEKNPRIKHPKTTTTTKK